MNWGSKIVIGLAAFMLFIIGVSIYMVSHDSDTLIDNDYYENSLSYDQVYDSKQNLINDNAKPNILLGKDTLTITFVTTNNQGKLIFKRPSDGGLDREIPFATADRQFKLPITTFVKGNWSLDISWENSKKSYLHSQSLYIQ